MVQGNKGFAQGVAGGATPLDPGTRLPPRTGILSGRDNRLAELASGSSVTRVHELTDPARCRIWDGHNRDYTALNETNCSDLIESFKAQGRQEVAAIVRRVSGDPERPYEVICGARRHWTVAWMRAHDYPDFKFLIEVRELSDEEAFRVSDIENRSRKDLSDYERAMDYARAVERYYGGSQQRMAERLEVTKSWLSRYLELARLPPDVISAFSSPHLLGISHAGAIAPLLRVADQRQGVLAVARAVSVEQSDLSMRGAPLMSPAAVVRRLVEAARMPPPKSRRAVSNEVIMRNPEGAILIRGSRSGRAGGLAISVPNPSKHNRSALLNAFSELLDRLRVSNRAASSGDR
jgi:ParB family transcriptional regulator, chromosome partitioning protein